MTETVPADIAAAIDRLEWAAQLEGHGDIIADPVMDAGSARLRAQARAALDAAILHHLRAYAEMKAALERIEQGS